MYVIRAVNTTSKSITVYEARILQDGCRGGIGYFADTDTVRIRIEYGKYVFVYNFLILPLGYGMDTGGNRWDTRLLKLKLKFFKRGLIWKKELL